MYFEDREDAGRQLAEALMAYRGRKDAIAIGLPRGGVVVAFEVAYRLGLPLDIICPRKVGAPFNPELAIGAVTETGQGMMNERLIAQLGVPANYIKETSAKEAAVAQQRLHNYRKGRTARVLKGKTVLLIDDGIATGATMKAAILTAKAEGAAKIVVAAPVAPPATIAEMQALTDQVVVLHTPYLFEAVGQFYTKFASTEDEEVIDLMKRA